MFFSAQIGDIQAIFLQIPECVSMYVCLSNNSGMKVTMAERQRDYAKYEIFMRRPNRKSWKATKRASAKFNWICLTTAKQQKKKLFVLKIRFITYKSGKCIYIDILYVCIYICKTIAKAPLTLTTATLKNNLSRFTY